MLSLVHFPENFLKFLEQQFLTLLAQCIAESCIKIKIQLIFYFHTSLWCLIKPPEAPQKSVKIFVRERDGKG